MAIMAESKKGHNFATLDPKKKYAIAYFLY